MQRCASQLESQGRLPWLADEIKVLCSPATYEQHPENAWERFRNRLRRPRDLAVMMEVAAWREEEAQGRDVPRSRILKDDVLIEIALAAPRTPEALAELRAVPRGMERSKAGAEIIDAVGRGLDRDPKTLPKLDRERRNGGGGATVELLKVLLRQVAEANSVAAKIVATVDDLEAIAADDGADVPAMHGWRRTIFGTKALELKAWAPRFDGGARQGGHARVAGRGTSFYGVSAWGANCDLQVRQKETVYAVGREIKFSQSSQGICS